MKFFDMAKSGSSAIADHADFILVGMIVAVIVLMIIPLPTPMVDLLIAINLGASFIILMMTMYVPNVLAFSSFPTLLLFTTLFRVGLNISTTRLILLQADAGEIIFTFGEFAVGGNFIVGAVVFIIISIVQFLVIAKGAERVSEVGARFSLDAMPGKQMSIDADLRAGAISSDEAQARRGRVAKESQMYGAMDGAMKFVKGDAIAGLLVAAVNIVAGTIIGVTQNGISAGDALQLYGILTIGDGLVSQIPSLLIAISAGILVTRSGEESSNVGSQIGNQIFGQPRAILIASSLVFLFGLVPGFPKVQLFSLALLLCGVGYSLQYMKDHGQTKKNPREEIKKALKATTDKSRKVNYDPNAEEEFSPVVPLILDISPDLSNIMDYEELNGELASLRRVLYFDLGVPFPGVHLRENTSLQDNEYILHLNEIPITRGTLEKDSVLVRDDPDNVRMLGIPVTEGTPFLPGEKSWWVKTSFSEQLDTLGISHLTHAKVISLHLSLVLVRHCADFIGLQEAKYLLDKMEERAPDLVHEATRLLPLQKFADCLKRLVQEQISIRDMKNILEAIIQWAPKEKDQVMLCEYIRTHLKRQISYKYCAAQNFLPAVLLEPNTEEIIRKSIRQTSSGAFLALDPASTKAILKEVGRVMQRCQGKVVIIASIDIRRYFRRLIETDFYEVPVLDYQELTPEISVQPLDKIAI